MYCTMAVNRSWYMDIWATAVKMSNGYMYMYPEFMTTYFLV